MPIDSTPDRIHIVIRNRYEMSQFWKWGDLTQPMPPSMRSVLQDGKRIAVEQKPQYVSVLAPVHNSLNDIVGLWRWSVKSVRIQGRTSNEETCPPGYEHHRISFDIEPDVTAHYRSIQFSTFNNSIALHG